MEKETEINTTQDSFISISSSSQPVQNLHKVFSKFDDNIAENISKVDYLFKSGANPNMFDKNGRTIFHICVINNQIEGLKFLFSINLNNPNFLDLETRTMNEGRNIFHLSCFLKNF